jgi:hypothetical protein
VKLYLLCSGSYEDRYAVGIFSTLEGAMGAAGNIDWHQSGDLWFSTASPSSYDIEQFELDKQ